MADRIASGRGRGKTAVLVGISLLLIIVLAAAQQFVSRGGLAAISGWATMGQKISLSRAEELAVLNGRQLDDYAAGYLERNNNFDDLEYVVVQEDKHPVRLMIGNRQDDLKGLLVNDKRFVVQLMACDWMDHVCGFRINGVPTGAMKANEGAASEFLLDQDYKLVLRDAQFDFCDNRRFCNLHFEAYDIVDVEIEKR